MQVRTQLRKLMNNLFHKGNQLRRQRFKVRHLLGFVVGGMVLASGTKAIANDQEILLLLTDPLTYPLDIQLLQSDELPADGSITTANTISQDGLTVPSLWWTQEQFGNKLLENWLAYSGTDGTPRRVDLVVNQQIWSLYTYLERYTFVNHFGTAAWDFGYQTRVFNRNQELLAAYVCQPHTEAVPVEAEPLRCNLFLDSRGTGALEGRSTSPFGGSPRGDGTGQR